MENVTEELVRQNGNQAATVMADYAGQGGGSQGTQGFSYPVQSLVRRTPTGEDLAKFADPSGDENTAIDIPNAGHLPVQFVLQVDNVYAFRAFTLLSGQNGDYSDVEDPIDGEVYYGYWAGSNWVAVLFHVDREATVLLGSMPD